MGTRAAFWIGDPRDIKKRKWIGCKAWDGYPDGLPELADVKTEGDFRSAITKMSEESNDIALPTGGWPYPWDDDIFLTDYTYAFFNGQVMVACYHSGFVSWAEAISDDDGTFEDGNLPRNVPAPKGYDTSQPDSIIIVTSR